MAKPLTRLLKLLVPLIFIFMPCFSCPAHQRDSLLQFKSSLFNQSDSDLDWYEFPALNFWDSISDCCTWPRVVCSSHSRDIIALQLDFHAEVNSRVFDPIFSIRSLLLLDVSYNRIVGEVWGKGLANLTKLVHLDMSHNYFNGSIPAHLFKFKFLQSLNLSSNFLTGGLSSEVGKLGNLKTLNLDHNSLDGNIPLQIGNLTQLQQFSIRDNKFWGRIPDSIGNLKGLERLDVSNNYLQMQIPSEIGSLSNISTLALSNNNFTGKNFLTWYGPRAELFVTEVEFIKEIMNNIQDYPKIEMNTGFVKVLLGDGLVTAKGKKWAKQRKLANQVFHAESLKSMTPEMIASVEMMLDRWKQHEGEEIDVFQEFKFLSSEIISRTAFGSSFMEGKDIFDMLTEIAIIITRNTYRVRLPGLSRFFKSKDDIRSEKLEQGIHDSILRIMERRKKESGMRVEVGSFGTDFLGSLMKAMTDSDQDKRITLQDVVDECKTFYVAGQETTSTLLSWVVFLLGSHTDWQEKARQEVLNMFGKEQPQSDGIARLKIVNMIINETLRLYPPVTEFTRQVKEETKLGNYILPANIHVVLSTLALHHDTNIWGGDAHEFKPERFSQGVAKATNNNPAVYIPFGLGPRSCVGLNFATNEAKISLAMILQRYSFTLSPNYIHSPIQILTTRPQHGVQVMLRPL